MTSHDKADPPEQAERPVPLTAAPEGTSNPADWATPDQPQPTPTAGGDDQLVAERELLQRDERQSRAAGDEPEAAPAGDVHESGYPTERNQGAAQPGPSGQENS